MSISSLILLSSCTLPGTQDEAGIVEENTVAYEDSMISMRVPKNWTGADIAKIPSPRVGIVVAAFISPEVKSWYSNNLIILADNLSTIMTSKRYSELNNLQTTKNYLEYKKISEGDMTFTDSEVSKYYVFEARYNETTPRMQFVQTARMCGTKAYLLHFTLALDKNPDNYSELFKTFTCK